MRFAEILFDQKVGINQETLTYEIPEHLNVEIGHIIETTIRNRKINGIVFDIHENKPRYNTKKIIQILKEKPILSKKQIRLIKWISSYYICPLYKTLKLFVPTRILKNKPLKRFPDKFEHIFNTKDKQLTQEQEELVNKIIESKSNKFLIHGITGSGKTETYVHLAKSYISKGFQVLILVPEISLTPQTIEYFENALGEEVASINSKLSEGEKYVTWKNIWNNNVRVVIGSRSAIFSPFQKLGLIIIDEEHENSYKQESSPRYFTHTVAEKLMELNKEAKLVLGSATPSIESIEKYKETTLTLDNRIGKSTLPEVEIVDLRDEFKKGNYSILSEKLRAELIKTLKDGNQAIIFINRRGTSSSIICRDCGFTYKCKECDLPMTYHHSNYSSPSLICHHCGLIDTPPTICPSCKSTSIKFLGIGTERIETELKKEFPNVNILRADKDTTSKKHAFKNIYQKFRNEEAQILIGTQMIAKGLHLPKVSLVGVILADIGLNIPDFRTLERNYQLLTQVSGRAGRSNDLGKVIIQTYNPDNIALIATKNHSFKDFFNFEREQRKILSNPPFSQITKFLIEEKSEKESKLKQEEIKKALELITNKEENEINLYPSYIYRYKGKYRNIVLLKSLKLKIHETLKNLPRSILDDPNIKIDVDPKQTT